MNQNDKKGFTLIELLVVISIISLLSAIVLASLNSARAKSRVAVRVSILEQLRTALEFYYNDNNGTYPINPNGNNGWASQCATWGGFAANAVIPGLVPTYIKSLPADPAVGVGDPTYNCLLYKSDGNGYKLMIYRVYDMSAGDIQRSPFVDQFYNTNGSCVGHQADPALSVYSSSPNWQCQN
jgi:prepilin-type N-terminal cleavage/methylation domain-containing protein